MRWLVLLPFVLSACGEPQSFDERYERTSERLHSKAETLDAQLANEGVNDTVAADSQRVSEHQ